MEKTLFLSVAILGLLTFGCLSSCQEVEFDVSPAVLQEHVFEQSFIKEFGKPSPDQTWDFYAQQMNAIRSNAGTTRATMAIDLPEVASPPDVDQPTTQDFKDIADSWEYSLEEGINNSRVGQNHFSLTSTGTFNIYAVNYGGGIEFHDKYNFIFGLIYIDQNDGQKYKMPLFHGGFNTEQGFAPTYSTWDNDNPEHWDSGNPGWGKEVSLPIGTRFYFYMEFTYVYDKWDNDRHGNEDPYWTPQWGHWVNDPSVGWWTWDNPEKNVDQSYVSNETPIFHNYFGQDIVYSTFGGNATLLYTTERVTADHAEQLMMIGLEDAWGLDGTNGAPDWMDLDYNDVVLVIDGELPLSDTKRFFMEDLSACDWDYNDVVIDVANNGITLRALGGTLPVWLYVKDKNGTESYTEELHKLLQDLQPQAEKHDLTLTYTRMINGEEKTFYKPIDVAANPGLWFDAVQIILWEISVDEDVPSTRLMEGELERFANPFVTNPIGDIKLLVGTEYGQSLSDAIERLPLDNDPTIQKLDFENYTNYSHLVELAQAGGIPAIWTGTTNVRWMKELQKITLGYHNFYGKGEKIDGFPQWWKTDVDDSYWYQFVGDVDPDAP